MSKIRIENDKNYWTIESYEALKKELEIKSCKVCMNFTKTLDECEKCLNGNSQFEEAIILERVSENKKRT